MFPIEIGVWHALLLATLFGFCAIYNRRRGWYTGSIQTLERLEQRKIIKTFSHPPFIAPGQGES